MASAVPVTAQMVGNAFVTQYYNVLHQVPQYVFRFYTDDSHLTHANAGSSGEIQMANTQNDIHTLVMSTDHKDCRAEIITVDAQDSFSGSVFVLVTGAMHKNDGRRNFVQSFFLAPQDRGYYVLNDIFRYLDEDTQSSKMFSGPPVHEMSNGVIDMYERLQVTSEAVPEMNEISTTIAEEAFVGERSEFLGQDPHEVKKSSIERVPDYHHIIEEDLSERTTFMEHPTLVEVHPPAWEEMTSEKKSYASILRASGGVLHHSAVKSEHSSYQQSGSSQSRSAHPKDDSTQLETQVDMKSVYVKNLPANVTDVQLADELKKFGPIKPSNISLRSNKDGGLYAFVDFEDANSALYAIEASPLIIGGRKVHIEERKSVYIGGGRGRGRSQGRLSNIQSNIFRSQSIGRGRSISRCEELLSENQRLEGGAGYVVD